MESITELMNINFSYVLISVFVIHLVSRPSFSIDRKSVV